MDSMDLLNRVLYIIISDINSTEVQQIRILEGPKFTKRHFNEGFSIF